MQVNNLTFMFFRALEVKTQKVLPQHLATVQESKSKEALIKLIMDDEDVDILAVDIRSQDHVQELLGCVVNQWVTQRGFALVSSWVEEYKLADSKKTKKQSLYARV